MEHRRFRNAVRNSAFSFGGQVLNISCSFVLNYIFIRTLGKTYSGVNSVMDSMLTLLSVAELGIGTSVAFALYKPVSHGDKEEIGVLMAFYKKTYQLIGLITMALGILMLPFMGFFTREVKGDIPYLTVIYFMFLAGTVISYFFSYKRTLINAYQNNYLVSITENSFSFVKHVLQFIVLLVWQNYILYLAINIVCVLGSNMVISIICDKKYGFIKEYRHRKLSSEDKQLMQKSVFSLMIQKVCAKLVTGTDNLMISSVNIDLMGVYSVYAMVVQKTIQSVVYNVLQSIMGTVGNLMVSDNDNHKYNVYEELVFTNFCLHFVVATGLAGVLQRFILLYAGDSSWLLSTPVVCIIIFNFFIWGMREPNIIVIEAAGLFNKLRAKAVAEVLVNLVASLLFLKVFKMGIYGVLLGTTVSMVTVCIWLENRAVHKYSFKRSQKIFYLKYFFNMIIAALGCITAWFVGRAVTIDGILGFVITGLVSVVIACVYILIFYYRRREFRSLLSRMLKRN